MTKERRRFTIGVPRPRPGTSLAPCGASSFRAEIWRVSQLPILCVITIVRVSLVGPLTIRTSFTFRYESTRFTLVSELSHHWRVDRSMSGWSWRHSRSGLAREEKGDGQPDGATPSLEIDGPLHAGYQSLFLVTQASCSLQASSARCPTVITTWGHSSCGSPACGTRSEAGFEGPRPDASSSRASNLSSREHCSPSCRSTRPRPCVRSTRNFWV